ncbi:MAG: hypothetical protein ACYSUJ_14040 [Planctomycetota bacterium]
MNTMIPHVLKLTLHIIIAMCFILLQDSVAQDVRADQSPPVNIDQIMAHLYFDKAHRKALLDGKVLSTGMPEMEQLREELAVAAIMLVVKAPMEKVIGAYLHGESFRKNSDIIEYKMIQGTEKTSMPVEEIFAPVGFTKEESSEVNKFFDFKGGSTFNFSEDEIKQLQAIDSKDSAVRDKVPAIFRSILMERYRSYSLRGLEGVEPYDRGRGKRSLPRRELTVAVGSNKLLENHFPDFYQALLKYPEEGVKRIKDEFYWFKKNMDNRPMFQLSHYMVDIRNPYALMADLHFYVEHTYNSTLTIIGCVPYEGGTVVFCTNRTFTDQVTGFGSSLKRTVGRRRIEDTLADHFMKLRNMLESKAN